MNTISRHWAPSTRATYQVGVRTYMRFCEQIKVIPFPICSDILELFVSSMAQRIGVKSMNVYLCGLQYVNTFYGFSEQISHMPNLAYVLRGIRRTQGPKFHRPLRAPILVTHLTDMFNLCSCFLNPHDTLMIRAAFTLAFFGLLRVSEYTAPQNFLWDPLVHLAVTDVSFSIHPPSMRLKIKASKTDPFRVGAVIRLVPLKHRLCPVAAMYRYLRVADRTSGPLFIKSDGTFLTRHHIVGVLRRCFSSPNLNTHSFRIGGASALANAGVPSHIIKQLGRWRSDAFLKYLRLSHQCLSETFSALVACNTIM